MLFSIIIPTYNRPDLLSKCLDCLKVYFDVSGIERAFKVEVIVTDDAGDSPAACQIRQAYPFICWVEGPGRGPAANRNFGASHSSGDCLVFLDDDCLPQQGWLEAYHSEFQKGSVLEGKVTAGREQERYDEESPQNETGGYLWSCNFAIDRSVFEQLRGFDESYIYAAMEDVDFFERLKKSGQVVDFLPNALVIHPWRIVSGVNMLKRRLMSHDIFWKKHPDLAPNHRFFYFAKTWARSFIKVTIFHLIRYRGQGILYRLSNDAYWASWALKQIWR